LAYHLVTDYPEVLEVSSIPEKEFDDQLLTNYNWMLKHDSVNFKQYYYEGLDGLKTGNTTLAGYTFTSTAEKDGRRLITVIMKTDSEDERFKETARLLDHGFDDFSEETLFEADLSLKNNENLPVVKGKEENVAIATADAIQLLIEKGSEEDYDLSFKLDESVVDEDGNLTAPIEKGEKVGTATLTYKDKSLDRKSTRLNSSHVS